MHVTAASWPCLTLENSRERILERREGVIACYNVQHVTRNQAVAKKALVRIFIMAEEYAKKVRATQKSERKSGTPPAQVIDAAGSGS